MAVGSRSKACSKSDSHLGMETSNTWHHKGGLRWPRQAPSVASSAFSHFLVLAECREDAHTQLIHLYTLTAKNYLCCRWIIFIFSMLYITAQSVSREPGLLPHTYLVISICVTHPSAAPIRNQEIFHKNLSRYLLVFRKKTVSHVSFLFIFFKSSFISE